MPAGGETPGAALLEPGRATPSDSRWVEIAALIFLGAAIAWSSSRLGFVDPDLWHEISLAREILSSGAVPETDAFAYTPTVVPVVHHEWGSGLLFLGVVRLFGGDALAVLRGLLAITVVGLAALGARRRGASIATVAALAPAVLVPSAAGFTTVRAQLLTLLFVALLLRLLAEDRAGRRWWIALWLPLHLVWLNLHGGFVVGLVLVGLHALEEALHRRPFRHLVLVAGAMAASIGIHPFGLDYYRYLARALTLDRVAIGEWAPIWRQSGPLVLYLFALSAVLALYALHRRGVRHAAGLLIVAATAAAGLLHARHFSIYAVSWLAFVPAWFEGTPAAEAFRRFRERNWRASTAIYGLGALLFLLPLSIADLTEARIPRGPRQPGRRGLVYPTGAVAYLADQRFQGNLQVPFVAGGYVMWNLHPRVRISLDGRYEVAYPPSLLIEHIAFYNALGDWRAMLDRYPTDAVLVPTDQPVATRMHEAPGWWRAYVDDSFEIWARDGATLTPADWRGRTVSGSLP